MAMCFAISSFSCLLAVFCLSPAAVEPPPSPSVSLTIHHQNHGFDREYDGLLGVPGQLSGGAEFAMSKSILVFGPWLGGSDGPTHYILSVPTPLTLRFTNEGMHIHSVLGILRVVGIQRVIRNHH